MEKNRLKTALTYFFLVLVMIFLLTPFIWLAICSISTRVELFDLAGKNWIPRNPTLRNYRILFFGGKTYWGSSPHTSEEYLITLRNSFITSIIPSIMIILIASPAAYALQRMRFPGREKMISFLLGIRMLPFVAILVPLYMIMANLQLIDSLIGLILVYTGLLLPFATFMLNQAFATVPKELEESARIDGCSRLGTLFRIVIPCALPGIAATIIYVFIGCWNTFFLALILTHSISAKTFVVAVAEAITEFDVDYTLMAAAGVFAAFIPVILAVSFQRYFIRGLVAGAVKR